MHRKLLAILLAIFMLPAGLLATTKKKAEEPPPAPPAPQSLGFCIVVDLKSQMVHAYNDGNPVFSSVTCTGKASTPTPRGNFEVINKHRQWTSTIYRVSMPYFLRLTPYSIGLHAGRIQSRPASHGCIRLPLEKAKELFELADVGTPVYVH